MPPEARNEQDDREDRKQPGPTVELSRGGRFGTEKDVEHRCGGGEHGWQ